MTEPIEQPRRAKRAAAKQPTPLRHSTKRSHGLARIFTGYLGAVIAVVLVSTLSLASIAVWDLFNSGNAGVDLLTKTKVGPIEGGVNLLVVGSDTRNGQSKSFGPNPGSSLNDVNIVLHIAADHKSATVLSIPRDMVVHLPDCPGGGGGWTGPINAALSEGGLACVAATVESFTGLKIGYAAMATFDGVANMATALGGVNVCVASPIVDSNTNLNLSAGMHLLKGKQATQFLRTRHGVGDGSDLGRISNQQVFMAALARQLKSASTLSNPLRLYDLAKIAMHDMILSSSLKNLDTMVSIAMAMKDVDLDKMVFVQYPGTTGGTGVYSGKVQPLAEAGAELMAAIIGDKPIKLTGTTGRGAVLSTPTPTPTPSASTKAKTSSLNGNSGFVIKLASTTTSATPTPTPSTPGSTEVSSQVEGQSADQQTCSKGN
jgi:LCP family protein required for cell wall assembly